MKLIFTPAQLRKMPHFVNLICIKTKITYSQHYAMATIRSLLLSTTKIFMGVGGACPHLSFLSFLVLLHDDLIDIYSIQCGVLLLSNCKSRTKDKQTDISLLYPYYLPQLISVPGPVVPSLL